MSIAQRELGVIAVGLGLSPEHQAVEEVAGSRGPGNMVTIGIECEHVTEVFTGFGERGVPAEAVAEGCLQQAREYLAGGVPVGEHLADQLLLPLALVGRGAFRTTALSPHAETNIDVIRTFLDVDFQIDDATPPGCVVRVSRQSPRGVTYGRDNMG